jgi:hypothetical protein
MANLVSLSTRSTNPKLVTPHGGIPTLSNSTSGSAATLTTPRAIYGNNFDGSAALGQIVASTYGGTGNGFTKFAGAATSEKVYTLPNATCTVLTSNDLVTSAQGGTGNGFTKFSGPTTAERTFTLPDATSTILTTNALVTSAQGGTGNGFTKFSGPATAERTFTLPNASSTVFTSGGGITLADHADDGAAAGGGIAVGQFYRNGSVVMIRVA